MIIASQQMKIRNHEDGEKDGIPGQPIAGPFSCSNFIPPLLAGPPPPAIGHFERKLMKSAILLSAMGFLMAANVANGTNESSSSLGELLVREVGIVGLLIWFCWFSMKNFRKEAQEARLEHAKVVDKIMLRWDVLNREVHDAATRNCLNPVMNPPSIPNLSSGSNPVIGQEDDSA